MPGVQGLRSIACEINGEGGELILETLLTHLAIVEGLIFEETLGIAGFGSGLRLQLNGAIGSEGVPMTKASAKVAGASETEVGSGGEASVHPFDEIEIGDEIAEEPVEKAEAIEASKITDGFVEIADLLSLRGDLGRRRRGPKGIRSRSRVRIRIGLFLRHIRFA